MCHSASTFLPPFAPRALPRFIALMRALTSVTPFRSQRMPSQVHGSLCFHCLIFRPFRPQPPYYLPLPSVAHYPYCGRLPQAAPWQTDQVRSYRHRFAVRVSPFSSRLTGRLGRNGFVLLWTGRSPPVASHLFGTTSCHPADAVTFEFRPESDCLKRTFTSLTKQLHTRTRAGVPACSRCCLHPTTSRDAWIGVGASGHPVAPPSEPDVRISRIRLSS